MPRVIARGRLRLLRRAVDASASISPRSTSDRTPPSMSARSPSCSRPPPGTTYLELDEEARVALLVARARNRRGRWCRRSHIQRGDRRRAQRLPGRRRGACEIRRGRDPQCIISMANGVSDMLEVAVLLKEAGLVDAPAAARSTSCRCSRPSTICRPPAHHGPLLSLPTTAAWSTAAAACRRSCSAIPTATRTAASSPRAGSSTRPRSGWSRCSSATACGCACSTAAAARSAAAADRAMTRSWPSPAAR